MDKNKVNEALKQAEKEFKQTAKYKRLEEEIKRLEVINNIFEGVYKPIS